eukprot:TRINITY_DN2577_c0_g1_i3.p1 TRINITY_DN2577_c0_g1~~TRINITY_DN2577_c0_g1_i3.p1  ORF type:complete len:234 (-),score=65.87 TRINITY_DN2577_c0_g1_i3:90-791(-)
MPRTIKSNKKKKAEKKLIEEASKLSITKTGKLRKTTRRKEKGTSVPLFLINGEKYISCYDIRNFLDDRKNEVKEDLKYEFRKKYQTFERKHAEDRLVLEQQVINKRIFKEDKIHINPNKKTVFIKLDQVMGSKGSLAYLNTSHKIPIDNNRVIDLDNKISYGTTPIILNDKQSIVIKSPITMPSSDIYNNKSISVDNSTIFDNNLSVTGIINDDMLFNEFNDDLFLFSLFPEK